MTLSYLLSFFVAIGAIFVLFFAPLTNTPQIESTEKVVHASWPTNYFEFGMVADLDIHSRDPEKFDWISYLRKGVISKNETTGKYVVQWTEKLVLRSHMATHNRSMELSDIVWWNGKYLCVCDFTGIVYKIRPRVGEVFPRFVLSDGDGKTLKTLKAEWMATKDGNLYIGSHGKEWVKNGEIMNRGSEWVKVISPSGKISSVNWGSTFQALRRATNTSFPGYLTHEAVLYNSQLEKWLFLPRKASQTPFSDEEDELKGTNLLLLMNKDLDEKSIEIRQIGPVEPEYGFSSFAKIPTSDDILVIKVRERGDEITTKLGIFDLDGNSLLELNETSAFDGIWLLVEHGIKYEGVEFLGDYGNH